MFSELDSQRQINVMESTNVTRLSTSGVPATLFYKDTESGKKALNACNREKLQILQSACKLVPGLSQFSPPYFSTSFSSPKECFWESFTCVNPSDWTGVSAFLEDF